MLYVLSLETDCTERRVGLSGSESSNGLFKSFIQHGFWHSNRSLWCKLYISLLYTHTYTHTHTHKHMQTYMDLDKLSILKIYVRCWFTSTIIQSVTFQQRCYNTQKFLYRTVTAEKATIHIVDSKIRKWPHRETFSASSSCCMNLWIRGKSTLYWKYWTYSILLGITLNSQF